MDVGSTPAEEHSGFFPSIPESPWKTNLLISFIGVNIYHSGRASKLVIGRSLVRLLQRSTRVFFRVSPSHHGKRISSFHSHLSEWKSFQTSNRKIVGSTPAKEHSGFFPSIPESPWKTNLLISFTSIRVEELPN